MLTMFNIVIIVISQNVSKLLDAFNCTNVINPNLNQSVMNVINNLSCSFYISNYIVK